MSEPARNPLIDSLRPVDRDARPSFKLADALLCVQCEHVYEQHTEGCPTCGSKQAYPVARRLDTPGGPPAHSTDASERESIEALERAGMEP